MGAMTEADLLSYAAELALSAPSLRLFYRDVIQKAAEFLGAEGGGLFHLVHDAKSFEVVFDIRGEPDFLSANFPRFLAEVHADEFRAALRQICVSDEIWTRTRQSKLALHQEYLRPRKFEHFVVRLWPTSRGMGSLVLAPGGNWDRFAERARALISHLFPLLEVGSKLAGAPDSCAQLRALTKEYRLTEAEHECVSLLLRGLTNREIAEVRRLSPNTIRNQLKLCFAKLGVSTRSEAVFVVMQALQGEHAASALHMMPESRTGWGGSSGREPC